MSSLFGKVTERVAANPVGTVRETLFILAGIVSAALIWALAAKCIDPGRFADPLFAAALSTIGLALVRAADGSNSQEVRNRRTQMTHYSGFWLISFTISFAAVNVSVLVGRIPDKIETPFWKDAARSTATDRRPLDPLRPCIGKGAQKNC